MGGIGRKRMRGVVGQLRPEARARDPEFKEISVETGWFSLPETEDVE
jgi:hypothetical protein